MEGMEIYTRQGWRIWLVGYDIMAIDYYFGAVKKGYAKFDPNALYSICQNDELGRLCCLVYFDLLMHLNRKDGKCFPTADRIAWELGYKAEDENGKIRHAEVSKAISKLEQRSPI